jgi:hypothetical protein
MKAQLTCTPSAITTYGNQGVLKRGCKASEHTIVYLRGSQPMFLRGERERGMTKEPIMIEPTDANETMTGTSRLRCGKIHSIEWNVKVRDIGMVSSHDRTRLLSYYRDEQTQGFDADDDPNDERIQQAQHRSRTRQPSYPHHPSYSQQSSYSQQPPYSQQPAYPNAQQPSHYPLQQHPYHQSQQATYQQPPNVYAQQYSHMASQQPPQNQHGNYSQHSSQPYPYPPQPPY